MSLFQVTKVARLLQAVSLNSSLQNASKVPSLPISTSAVMLGMPRRAKKKADPMVIRAREEKRRTRLEKALKKMAKKERNTKPVLEMKPSQAILSSVDARQREIVITEDMEDERIDTLKDWSRYSTKRHLEELRQIDGVIIAQKKALEALASLDMNLYVKALQSDSTLTNFHAKGPTYTPPITDYLQDGEYENTTKEYAIQYADTKEFLINLTRKVRRRRRKNEDDDA